MMRPVVLGVLAGMAGMLPMVANGSTLVNGDFESGLTNWQPAANSMGNPGNPWDTWGTITTSTAPSGSTTVLPAQGNLFAVLNHDGEANSTTDLHRLDLDISDGSTYLQFWLNVDLNPNGDFIPGSWARVILTDSSGTAIATLLEFGGSSDGHYGTNGWTQYTIDLSSYTTQTSLGIDFQLQTGNNYSQANQRLYVDGVSLVPEPTSLAWLGIGAAVLGRRRKTAL